MASPSVDVKVKADTTGVSTAMDAAAKKGASSATQLHTAFGGMLDALNKTGVLGPFGSALSGVNDALGAIAEHGKNIPLAMAGVGVALAGVGAGLTAIGSKDKAAHQQLQQSVEATGHSYDDYGKQVDAAIKKQEKFGHTAGETDDALRILTQATGDPAKALQYLGEASDLAAAKHESLNTAATALGKAYNGNAKILKEFGITTVSSTTATKQLAADTKAAQTAADAAAKAHQHLADTQALLAGKTKLTTAEQITLRNAQTAAVTADQKSKDAADKLAAAQQGAAAGATSHGKALDELAGKLKGQAAAQADTFTGRLNAMKAKFEDLAANLGQKYGPALTAVGSGLAGVGAAIQIVTALHIGSVAGWLADAAAAAAAAVAENLALLGIPILIAAVVAGIAWMVTHWQQVKNAVMDVWNWIKDNWPLLLAILTGPFGIAVYLIVENFKTIKQWAADAVNFIIGLWNGLVGFFTGLPGRLAGIFAGMWNGIFNAFRGVINQIIDLWNGLHFQLPKIDVLGVHVGGETIGVPTLPHLAQGGLITQTGLVYAHAGEAITPAPGRAGPAVHIDNVNVSDGADIDLLLSKIAFAAGAGRL